MFNVLFILFVLILGWIVYRIIENYKKSKLRREKYEEYIEKKEKDVYDLYKENLKKYNYDVVEYLLDNIENVEFHGCYTDWLEPYIKYDLYGIEIKCIYFPEYSKIDRILVNSKGVPYSIKLEYAFEAIGQKHIH